MTPLDRTSFIAAVDRLASADSAMAAIVGEHDIPEFWHRPPGFATLALFIVEQQVSLASAKAVFERLVDLLGEVTPDALVSADRDDLGRAGLTRQKQRYLVGLAELVTAGTFDLADV
ncbi:MAG TPA: DNA-3-methyladenine glycosylase 2 family protein, partial [Acidimicrobiia bacterium]|nr:DNA-3-methyladenine glycosylase 2 family protein [Acidimicrobiia bacterium]